MVSFADSLRVVVGGAIPVMLFPRWFLRWGFPHLRRLSKALGHVHSYILYVMSRGLENPMARETGKRDFTTDGILNGLTGALAQGPTPGPNELTQSEVIGNIFMISLAGSGTTADTMHFAMIVLSLHQDIQSWVLEELDNVSEEFGEDWNYAQVFPKLVRIICVMVRNFDPDQMKLDLTFKPQNNRWKHYVFFRLSSKFLSGPMTKLKS